MVYARRKMPERTAGWPSVAGEWVAPAFSRQFSIAKRPDRRFFGRFPRPKAQAGPRLTFRRAPKGRAGVLSPRA